jgi:hypothetical protein
MAPVTIERIRTSFLILLDEVFCFPVGTGNRLIPVNVWLSSEILPVMSVDAESLLYKWIYLLLYHEKSN